MTIDTTNAQQVNANAAIAVANNSVEDFISSLSSAQNLVAQLEAKVAQLKSEISKTKRDLKDAVAKYADGAEGAEFVDVDAQKELIADMNFRLEAVKAQLKLLKSVDKAYNSYLNPGQK